MSEKFYIITILAFIFISTTILPLKATALSFNPDNPEEMVPGESITISIIGDCPPYTWVASGKGYSFESSETEDGINVLHADEDACGSVTISVADRCGEIITEEGVVRSTEGVWQSLHQCNYNCGECPECYSLCGTGIPKSSGYLPPYYPSEAGYELIVGGKRTWQITSAGGGCGGTWVPPLSCPPADTRCTQCPPQIIRPANCIDPRWDPESIYMCTIEITETESTVRCRGARYLEYFEWICPGVIFESPPKLDIDDCKKYQ